MRHLFLMTWIVVLQGATLSAQAQPASASAPTVAASAPRSATATTATKALSPHIIYRWTDANGRVQYSQQVPEDRQHTARTLDGRKINVVQREKGSPPRMSDIPAPPAQPENAVTNSAKPTGPSPSAPGLSARQRCEAAWREYEASVACFAQNRQPLRGGRSAPSDQANAQCREVPQPARCD
jgi:hypothetical protein